MAEQCYRGLVVDDEPHLQRLTLRALESRQISCDAAANGVQAAELLGRNRYDVVVTDLRMPERHGHSLATEILARADRPLLVILTGVMEPLLVEDLLLRGVDDILFKPIQFNLFAAKIRGLLDRRKRAQSVEPPPGKSAARTASTAAALELPPRIAPAALDERLGKLTSIVPISRAALDVLKLTREGDPDAEVVAAEIARDPTLTIEVLKLANSSYFNRARSGITSLSGAVVRLGNRRVGELALTVSALTIATPQALPWFNCRLAWRRSLACGLAIEALNSPSESDDEGLFLAALMFPLARVVTAMLFPEVYAHLIRRHEATGESLPSLESRVFPETCSATLARVLAAWNLPPAICKPLHFALWDFRDVAELSEPLRQQVEQLKTAIVLGHLAIPDWESWDRVEALPDSIVERYGDDALDAVVRDVAGHVEELAARGVADLPLASSGCTAPMASDLMSHGSSPAGAVVASASAAGK